MGAKLLIVCGLVLLMMIPALFVSNLLRDRSSRAQQVTAELGALMGGPQTFVGPVLSVPYTVPAVGQQPTSGVYIIAPTSSDALVATASEVRQRSLFKTPVYRADLDLKATFDLAGVPHLAPPNAVLNWSRAEFLIGVSDARGAQSEIVLSSAGKAVQLSPAATLAETVIGASAGSDAAADQARNGLHFFGAPAADIAVAGAKFDVEAKLKFTGAQRLALLATGKTTRVVVNGDWPHPSFDGGFLPGKRSVSEKGFSAEWSVPFIARGVPAEGTADTLSRLGQTALGVSFIEPANPYHSVERSIKYALLFVSLVFLTYFIFEILSGMRVHPAQYVLVGLAQTVFYLLLLSIAERTGFDIGFLISAVATVALISVYAYWVFESRTRGLQALAAFSVVYGLIYVLMRLEDTSLLVGAVASFAAIAAVMYFTRRIDWYGVTSSVVPDKPASAALKDGV